MSSVQEEIKQEGEFQYLEKGEGEVLILLHGLFGALSNFEEVIGHFSRKYRVTIPMLPIYSMPVINTNVKNLAKFLHRFILHKGYERVHLLGNSLGGHIALIYVNEHGDKVSSVTLTGSSGLYENTMGNTFPRREDYDFVEKKVKETFYDPEVATRALIDECFEIVNNKKKLIRILALAKSAIRHNMGKELPKFDIPFCLIWGKNDTVTPPYVAEEFQRLLPRADLYWIDKCGHAPMMEHPKQFNQLFDQWLSQTLRSHGDQTG